VCASVCDVCGAVGHIKRQCPSLKSTVETKGLYCYHRLNGSSSHVLTATSLYYGKAKNLTSHRIKTPDLIEIKFGTVDYVSEVTPHAKFHVNLTKGASQQLGEIYAKFFLAIYKEWAIKTVHCIILLKMLLRLFIWTE